MRNIEKRVRVIRGVVDEMEEVVVGMGSEVVSGGGGKNKKEREGWG
jgi:hypothetical protein